MNHTCHAEIREHILKHPCLPVPDFKWDQLEYPAETADNPKLNREAKNALIELKLALLDRSAYTLLFSGRYNLGLLRLADLRKEWCAAPTRWKRKTATAHGQFKSLVKLLIDQYPVPTFLHDAWTQADGLALDWYLHLARGGSVRRLPHLPIKPSKKTAHLFRQIPAHLEPEEGLMWAQVRSLGGDKVLFEAIMSSFLGNSFIKDEFWLEAIQWLVRQPERKQSMVAPVLDYLRHRHQETHVQYRLKGRTWASVVRGMHHWHGELRAARIGHAHFGWRAFGIQLYISLGKGARKNNAPLIGQPIEAYLSDRGALADFPDSMITITQVLSNRELSEEGAALRHCVYSYRQHCTSGVISIWSMRTWGGAEEERILTIEIDNHSRQIVQIRGIHNRLARREEMGILRAWAKREKLGFRHCN
ncbi:MAG: PcfJ domain-containing protein [Bacteroidota bacterium]